MNTLQQTTYAYTSKQFMPNRMRLGLAGDCKVGKTSLMNKYKKDEFSEVYIKTKD